METCKIQWIDEETGLPTPDNNEAVGYVYQEAYRYENRLGAQPIDIPRSDNYPICAEHLKQLDNSRMQHWHFTPYGKEKEK